MEYTPSCRPPYAQSASVPAAAPSCRALLKVADQNGNSLQDCWSEVLRCVSRFELLQQATAGVPTDALLFAMPAAEKESAASRLKHKLVRHKGGELGGLCGVGLAPSCRGRG